MGMKLLNFDGDDFDGDETLDDFFVDWFPMDFRNHWSFCQISKKNLQRGGEHRTQKSGMELIT